MDCKWAPSHSAECRISDLGYALFAGNANLVRRVLRNGASPNEPCHLSGLPGREVQYPLDLVTDRKYHDRSDECFLALVGAGATIQSHDMKEVDIINLKDQLRKFAFRPNASPLALRAVLQLGIADTEPLRERLAELAIMRCWYYYDIKDINGGVWVLQDDHKYLQRQCIALRKVPFSEDQRSKFWRGARDRVREEEEGSQQEPREPAVPSE